VGIAGESMQEKDRLAGMRRVDPEGLGFFLGRKEAFGRGVGAHKIA
jgi:hypothetical protein